MERIGLEPGSQIGGYTIVAPLGSGGMGTVYRAVDDGGAAVALKLLHPQIGADAQARERLRREVVALQRLKHPAIAAVLDAEADSTEAFLVTELVDGLNLADHVRAKGPLSADELHELAAGLRDALAAVHDAGVVHRDLKPSNVIVAEHGPVLIDFGVARAAGDDADVTSTGLVVGTPGYLAPELLAGADPTPATDLWGWAAVLAFAATGRAPFGVRPVEVVLARAGKGDVDLDGLGPVTAGALADALAADPDERLDPDDLVAALALAAAEGDEPDLDRTLALAMDDDEGDDDPDEGVDATEVMAAAAATVAVARTSGGKPGGKGAPKASVGAPVNDGNTRVMAVEAGETLVDLDPADDESPDEYDDDHDGFDDDEFDDEDSDGDEEYDKRGRLIYHDATVEWIEDDLDASEGVQAEGSGYARPAVERRYGSLLAIALLVGVAGALAPTITLLVVGILMLVERTYGTAVESMHARRERAGVRPSDAVFAIATSPWHFVRTVLGMIPSLVVGMCVMLVVGGVLVWLVEQETLHIGDLSSGDPLQGTAAAVYVGALVFLGVMVVWWGPLSRMTRLGARRLLAVAAPGRIGALVLVGVCLAAALVVATLISNGADIVWTPAPTPTIP